MSVEPPSSGRPTGPPSGPLSGPGQPPSGPEGPSRGGGNPEEPHRRWWRSAPRVALATAAVVAVAAVAVLLTRSGGSGGSGSGKGGEVFLQAADTAGRDPFTASSATESSAPPASLAPASAAGSGALQSVSGNTEGLYGGTRNTSSCDIDKQIRFLSATPAKNTAFASTVGVKPGDVPGYLRSLTPVQLRVDTRVTNHGYVNGHADAYQSVLQAGTAVLVDPHGVPRVRCACGNPLGPAVAQHGTPRPTGGSWPGYRPADVVVIAPSVTVINVFVLYDPGDRGWIARDRGTWHHDRPTKPPAPVISPTPSPSSTPSHSQSPSQPPSPSTSPSVSPSTSPSSPSPSPSPSNSPAPSPSQSPSGSPSPSPSPSLSPLAPSPSPSPSAPSFPSLSAPPSALVTTPTPAATEGSPLPSAEEPGVSSGPQHGA